MRSKTSTLRVKKQNKSAFSLVIAILLVLIMSLLVLYILEYMIPYSKNVKGIENSSNAFYQAENSIEDALYKFKIRTDFSDFVDSTFSSPVDYKYTTTSSGQIIPVPGEGNSEFDKDYNKISQGNPIQLKVGNGVTNLENIKFTFNVPKIEGHTYTLSGSTMAIINWQLTTENDKTLNASGSQILADDIDINNVNIFNGSNKNSGNIEFANGQLLDYTGSGMVDFYDNNCGTNSGCTLKMSIINKLESTTGVNIPYLEYKIELTNPEKIPLRYSRIKSNGKSYGFQKSLEVRVPQQTTNEAFDFTVFQ